MDNDALFSIINHCVGVIGYYEGLTRRVEQTENRIIVVWDHYGIEARLVFDKYGKVIAPTEE